MASNSKYLTLVFLLLSVVFLAIVANAKPDSVAFLKHLQGCHKGDNVTGLHKLKNYLKQFGYLDYHRYPKFQSHENDDLFDNLLEHSLKTYQRNFHLHTTGALDAQTVSKMESPRCGVPDIVNGTNYMRGHKNQNNSHVHIHGVEHFTFFPNQPRWPASKTRLTYAFSPNTPANKIPPVARAFNQWASISRFTFSMTRDFNNADMKIGFFSGNHGDGSPFDGRGKVIAHAFAPTDGRFHFDADEKFSVGVNPDAFHVETIALHEIGHLLGLGHSRVEGAIMYPTIGAGITKGLDDDDIQGIRTLYSRG